MTAPQPAQPVRTAPVAWSHSHLILIICFVCFLIAALTAAAVLPWGPWKAWALGGVAAWVLSALIP